MWLQLKIITNKAFSNILYGKTELKLKMMPEK